MSKPPVKLDLTWQQGLVFSGTSGNIGLTLDSDAAAGPSPMQALAFALAGCMAMDLVHILQKGRHELGGLRAELTGVRAPEDPKRFTQIALHYTITGAAPESAVQRAIDLSRDKYCSVWQSMRQDIDFVVTFSISAA